MARALSPGEAAAPSAPVPISPPPWLSESFPRREWESLRSCRLRVDEETGAGLDVEECASGVHIDAVSPSHCQDPLLRPGDVIISICGEPLMGLPDNAVGAVFGRRFADGAELLLLSSAELRRAEIERDAAGECPCEEPGEPEDPTRVEDLANYDLLRRTKSSTEYDAVVRIPVGRSAVWRLSADVMALLENDLTVLGGKFGVSAKPQLNRDGDVQCVVVSGLSTAIASARSEVVQVLQFYRQGQGLPGAATGPADRSSWAEDRPREEARAAGAAVACGVRVEVPEHVEDLRQFEYHDHTADIIVHAWGRTRAEAFAQVCVGMFNYMTDLDRVDIARSVDVEATGHDLLDLLYHLLDEFLYVFGSELHVSRRIEILEFDEVGLRIRARGYGEKMDLGKHEQGTEIKAVTMHMMKIVGPDGIMTEGGTMQDVSNEKLREGFPYAVTTLLDI